MTKNIGKLLYTIFQFKTPSKIITKYICKGTSNLYMYTDRLSYKSRLMLFRNYFWQDVKEKIMMHTFHSIFVFFFRQPYLNDMIKFLRHRMKFHKLSRWHEVINQLLHLWNSRSNYPKNAEGEPKYEKSKNSCHI